MISLEEIKKEMLKRGAVRAQTEAKVVPMILDIISENPDIVFLSLREAEEELGLIRQQLEAAKRSLEAAKEEEAKAWDRTRGARLEAQEAEKARNKKIEEAEGYIGELVRSLRECETKEGRDRIRVAQQFVDSVKPQGVSDNAAFIVGLATILAGGEAPAIKTWQKIDETAVMEQIISNKQSKKKKDLRRIR